MAFTKYISSLSTELGKEPLSKPAIIAYFNTIEEKTKELSALNLEILEIILDDEKVTEEEMKLEVKTSDAYKIKYE